jgi:hypothetical protein
VRGTLRGNPHRSTSIRAGIAARPSPAKSGRGGGNLGQAENALTVPTAAVGVELARTAVAVTAFTVSRTRARGDDAAGKCE